MDGIPTDATSSNEHNDEDEEMVDLTQQMKKLSLQDHTQDDQMKTRKDSTNEQWPLGSLSIRINSRKRKMEDPEQYGINSKKMKMEELVAIAQPSNHNESGELAIPQSNSNPHNTVVPQSSLPQNITDMNTTGAQNIPRESSSSGVYQASDCPSQITSQESSASSSFGDMGMTHSQPSNRDVMFDTHANNQNDSASKIRHGQTKKPYLGKTGLKNHDVDCCKNVVIQALFMVMCLRSMLLGESYTDPVTYIVGNLFALLLEEKKPEIDPRPFYDKLDPPWLSNGNQQDSLELLKQLIESFNAEVKALFTGEYVVQCRKCDLILSERKEFNVMPMAFADNQAEKKSCNWKDLVLQKTGQNQFQCDKCSQDTEQTYMLTKGPKILIFSICRRNADGTKITKGVDPPSILDVPVMTGNVKQEKSYCLRSMVVHVGDSPDFGHFYCFSHAVPNIRDLGTLEDVWYRMNDGSVDRMNAADVTDHLANNPSHVSYVVIYEVLDSSL